MMKAKSLFVVALFAVLLVGCAPTSFYQMYKVVPTGSTALKDSRLVYEDESCKVSYDIWSEGGDIGFRFYNKTAQSIYLNLEESFFVLNGISYNYYRNRVYSNSSAIAAIGLVASSGHAVSYIEEKLVCIPSMTSKIITEYTVNKTLYRDCDLFMYPGKKEVKAKKFTKADSPFVFSNRIIYSVGSATVPVKFENEFYVTEITNYPEKEVMDFKYADFCGQSSALQSNFFKHVSPDMFYINYKKGTDYWKH